MRVLTSINGRRRVTEVLEFEPLNENTVILYAAEPLCDIKLTGVDVSAADSIANKLLTCGYADLSKYHAEYDEDDDDNPKYEVECPACFATLHVDADIYEAGEITCPCCGQALEFDATEETQEARPTYLIKCRCGAETRFDAEVLLSGQAYCPSCFRECSAVEVEDEPEDHDVSQSVIIENEQPTKKRDLVSLFPRKPKNNDRWEL